MIAGGFPGREPGRPSALKSFLNKRKRMLETSREEREGTKCGLKTAGRD